MARCCCPGLTAAAAHRAGPRRRGGVAQVRGRGAVRDAAEHRQGGDGHRVAGAACPGPHAGGALAALPELRDGRHPALAGGGGRGPGAPGRWRLYLSCATPGTKHWRVEMTEAAHPGEFDVRQRSTVLPGDAKTGVKDPVIRYHDDRWHLWASCHPLADPQQTDQMTTEYATSPDGLAWTWHGTALSGPPGRGDSRGTRVTSVDFGGGVVTAYYDGRASAAENYEERTGVAAGADPAALTAADDGPAACSPYHGGGLRYLDVVALPDGRHRLYYEMTRPDGAPALVTEPRWRSGPIP